jgi:carboxypeptidase PM20D1
VKRVLAFAALGLAVLVAVVLARAAMLPSRQIEVPPAPPLAVDANAVAQRLALAVRHETVSYQESDRLDRQEFRALASLLRAFYPRAHRALQQEAVNELSLLYTWPGRNPALAPVLLAAHLDVVPIDPGSGDDWTHPPFEGVVEDGVVWGRGAIDAKANLICILDAVERLLADGFEPERTVYLAFGHDEEVGGYDGALAIAKLLESRGVALAFPLDEGGVVAEGFLPGLPLQVAVVGIAEKGSVSIAMELEAEGGHSSTPPPHTAIGGLAAGVVALEENPMPAGIDGVVGVFLDHLAPELPFWARVVLANRWLFGPALRVGFSRVPPLDAMQRTTTAVTIFQAGVKANVLPIRARAIANFRIHPRDSVETVTAHVRRTLDDERVRLHVGVRTPPRNPSPVSPVDGEAFATIQRSVREVFPDAAVVPYLVVGGTDGRHYHLLTDGVYRLSPFVFGRETLRLVHGTDERISAENLARGVRFFERLLRNGAGAPGAPAA